jgi:hypothetical protein
MRDPWRCALCGDVIGVYEPVVIVEAAHEYVGSPLTLRADGPDGERYHQAWAAPRDAGARRPAAVAEEQRRAA